MKKYILLISLALIIISGCAEQTLEQKLLDASEPEQCYYLASEKANLDFSQCMNTMDDCSLAEMYRHYSITCIANIAKRNSNITLCSEERIKTEVCDTYAGLMRRNLTKPCMVYFEDLCLTQYSLEN